MPASGVPLVPCTTVPLNVIVGLLPFTRIALFAASVLVTDVPVPNTNAPDEPSVIPMRPAGPLSVVVPLKLYVPSAFTNCKP